MTENKQLTQASRWSFKEGENGPHQHSGRAVERNNLDFLKEMMIGSTLNVCCGYDNTGDVLTDLEERTLRERQSTLTHKVLIRSDVENLPFVEKSFDTVICDPPYSFYGRHAWINGLFRVARERVILSAPTVDVKSREGWNRDLYYIKTNHFFLRLWWVFRNHKEDNK